MPSPFPNLPAAQRGAVRCLTHRSTVLAGNPWGDPTERDLWVYTPAGAEDTPLPAVLLLAGFAGTGEGMLARGLTEVSITSRIDRLIANGCPPFIAVLPDCMTTLGGSQFIDSPALGAYGSYLTDEIMPFIDATLKTTRRWGATGRSSGGFGALTLAMRSPGTLDAVACHAGDMGFDLCYLGDIPSGLSAIRAAGGPRALVDAFWAASRPSGSMFAALNLLCMSAAYSPDPDAADFPARLPVDWQTGVVDFDTFDAWRAFDPVRRIEDAAAQDALRALSFLMLDAGNRDEHHLHLGARQLVARLKALDIPHTYEEFPGGHRGTSHRYDISLPRLAAALHEDG
ncbi:MAG: enterochelin esterase-like enzyme [Myxococcota bacterium]|jgi:enterochelin esterase-like enzyme